jgi:hypothetical protein
LFFSYAKLQQSLLHATVYLNKELFHTKSFDLTYRPSKNTPRGAIPLRREYGIGRAKENVCWAVHSGTTYITA